MKKGGYQIIDLKNTPLTSGSGAMVIDGIYSSIESTNKAILVSGIVIDGVEHNDTFVELTEDGSNYVGTMYGKTITIQDNDVVSVAGKSSFEKLENYNSYQLESDSSPTTLYIIKDDSIVDDYLIYIRVFTPNAKGNKEVNIPYTLLTYVGTKYSENTYRVTDDICFRVIGKCNDVYINGVNTSGTDYNVEAIKINL